MKVSIEGHHFDTDNAAKHWEIVTQSGWAMNEGDEVEGQETVEVYCSSGGTFYVNISSQWRLMTASEILSTYDGYLNDEVNAEIAEFGGVQWE
jgi:hypothetical protein